MPACICNGDGGYSTVSVTWSSHLPPAVLQDPFGNYVVQYVLELGHPEATTAIMLQLCGHYAELAQQKFSSNVVEKCLKLGGPSLADMRERVIRELVASPLLPRLLQVCAAVCCRPLLLIRHNLQQLLTLLLCILCGTGAPQLLHGCCSACQFYQHGSSRIYGLSDG